MDKSNQTITKDNRLIEASYTLTISEQRVLLACISQVDSRGVLNESDGFDVSASDIADLIGIDQRNAYRDIQAAIDKLYHRSIRLDDEGSEARWISKKIYSGGTATIYFSAHVIPYLSELSARFTTYKLAHVAKFKNVYSIRLYELLVQWASKGERELSVDKIRYMLQIGEKYTAFKDFRRYVIQIAVNEINEHSNLWCEYGVRKFAQAVTHVQFKFGLKSETQPRNNQNFITDDKIKAAARPGETKAQVISRLKGQDLSKVAKPGETIEQVINRQKAIAEINKAVGRGSKKKPD